MEFLPDGEREQTKSNYMKFKEGANKFRILSSAIVGNEAWQDTEEGRRPIRFRIKDSIPSEYAGETKYFWAFVVYNYLEEKIQILELTQKGIREDIRSYTQDEDWGDPKEYDITVTKTGDGLETKYQTKVSPKKKLTDEISTAYETMNINLDALFTNKDPFDSRPESKTSVEDEINGESIDKIFAGKL